ncbi:hypothetical protein SDC9_166803 [bioreactor metagenome]|uniref:Uncharacterized protein n=1 Tax=bioreactor metagenome TaxID=1076179 RepID=A0A645G5L9_9ZZZZ
MCKLGTQVGIPHLQQFGIVIFREYPQFRFARPVNTAIVKGGEPVQLIDPPCQADVRVQFPILIFVIGGIINVIRRNIIKDTGIFTPQPKFEIYFRSLHHPVRIEGCDIFAPVRPVTQPGIDNGLISFINIVRHG